LPQKIHNVLFLCTGNSARSIMAECAMNRWESEQTLDLSAGSRPKAAPHPFALDLIAELGAAGSSPVIYRSPLPQERRFSRSPAVDFESPECETDGEPPDSDGGR